MNGRKSHLLNPFKRYLPSNHYLSIRNHIYDTVVTFHRRFQKLNIIISFVNSFGEFDVSPFKETAAALV